MVKERNITTVNADKVNAVLAYKEVAQDYRSIRHYCVANKVDLNVRRWIVAEREGRFNAQINGEHVLGQKTVRSKGKNKHKSQAEKVDSALAIEHSHVMSKIEVRDAPDQHGFGMFAKNDIPAMTGLCFYTGYVV